MLALNETKKRGRTDQHFTDLINIRLYYHQGMELGKKEMMMSSTSSCDNDNDDVCHVVQSSSH